MCSNVYEIVWLKIKSPPPKIYFLRRKKEKSAIEEPKISRIFFFCSFERESRNEVREYTSRKSQNPSFFFRRPFLRKSRPRKKVQMNFCPACGALLLFHEEIQEVTLVCKTCNYNMDVNKNVRSNLSLPFVSSTKNKKKCKSFTVIE